MFWAERPGETAHSARFNRRLSRIEREPTFPHAQSYRTHVNAGNGELCNEGATSAGPPFGPRHLARVRRTASFGRRGR